MGSCGTLCVSPASASSKRITSAGLVKYAKPAGVIASLVPMTNPVLTPPGTAINAMKARDAVIFSPHPRTKETPSEAVRIMRDVLEREGAPADLLQCVEKPSIPIAQELMAICDMTIATGGPAMVKAAYSSGKPAFGVGAGNSTIVIDETADIEEAARNTRMSKTSDFGSGCSADGNALIDDRIYDELVERLQVEGGYLANAGEKATVEEGDVGRERRPHHRRPSPNRPPGSQSSPGSRSLPRRHSSSSSRRTSGASTGSRARN